MYLSEFLHVCILLLYIYYFYCIYINVFLLETLKVYKQLCMNQKQLKFFSGGERAIFICIYIYTQNIYIRYLYA